MANPRRVLIENQRLSPLINLLKKPQAFPLLLSFFLFLTWITLRLQHSSHVSSHPKSTLKSHPELNILDDDDKVNLVRFASASLSPVRKDDRGWLLDPIILARDSQLKGSSYRFRIWFLTNVIQEVDKIAIRIVFLSILN